MPEKVKLDIQGMTCATCVRRVEQGLGDLEGVDKASVNFATENAMVDYEPTKVEVEDLVKKVGDLGYKVINFEKSSGGGPNKTTVSVGGMTCAACVRRVESALQSAKGVSDAAVNLATGRATITHGEDWAGVDSIKGLIEDTGYEFLGLPQESLEDPVEAARVKEIKDLKIKFITGAVLSILVFIGSMQDWFPYLRSIPRIYMLISLLVLTTPVVFWVGSRFLTGAIKAARQKTTDMNTLVAMGALAAYFYSSLAIFAPWIFKESGHAMHVYFDGAAMIITLILLGRLLEAKAKGKTSLAIKRLIGLKPKTARVIRDNEERDVPVGSLMKGDVILVRPGEKIPTDGEVVSGNSTIDESMFTGDMVSKKAHG
ncbi:copper ion binding protein [Thermodesulfobacteriota bacterium]